jgi:hypothetical protein
VVVAAAAVAAAEESNYNNNKKSNLVHLRWSFPVSAFQDASTTLFYCWMVFQCFFWEFKDQFGRYVEIPFPYMWSCSF